MYCLIINVIIYLLVQQKSKLLHDLFPQQDGQELVVCDVLDLRDDDTPGLLEDSLIVPVRVDLPQSSGHPVVFPGHQGVHAGEDQLLVYSDFTWEKPDLFTGVIAERRR